MVNAPPDPAAISELLHFRCNSCFQALQVPIAFAGRSAPCPFCAQITTAPAPHSAPADPDPPTPPPEPKIQFPCPACHNGLSIPASLAGITGPCLFCHTTITAPQSNLAAPPARENPLEAKKQQLSETASTADPREPASPARRERSRKISSKPPSSQKPTSKRLLHAIGICSLTFGIAGTTVFFAGPGRNLFSAKKSDPIQETIYNKALANKDRLKEEQNQAIVDADSCIRGFLTAPNWEEASAYAVGMPQAPLGNKAPPLGNTTPENLTLQTVERRPDTTTFIVKHWLERDDGRPPAVIWVENTKEGARVRWDLLEQQLTGRIRQFKGSTHSDPTRFYARLHQINDENSPFSDIPELSDHMVIAVSSAFSSAESEDFYAFVTAGSSCFHQMNGLFRTTSSIEGWVTAEHARADANLNLISIKDFQFDIPVYSEEKTFIMKPPSVHYGNSGLLQ